MYFVCLGLLLVELEKMTPPKRSTSGTRLLRGNEFLDLPQHILTFETTENQ